jgi:hypothetical protein
MGAEPKRWTADEVHEACGRGDRDFRNADLAGLDLRGADLRGADFRGANLRGACLAGCQLGPTARWRPVEQTVRILMAAVTGTFSFAISLLAAKALNDKDTLPSFRFLGGLLLLAWLMSLARKGLSVVAFAPAIMMTAVIALTVGAVAAGTGANAAGVNAGVIVTLVFVIVAVGAGRTRPNLAQTGSSARVLAASF